MRQRIFAALLVLSILGAAIAVKAVTVSQLTSPSIQYQLADGYGNDGG